MAASGNDLAVLARTGLGHDYRIAERRAFHHPPASGLGRVFRNRCSRSAHVLLHCASGPSIGDGRHLRRRESTGQRGRAGRRRPRRVRYASLFCGRTELAEEFPDHGGNRTWRALLIVSHDSSEPDRRRQGYPFPGQ